MQESKDLFQILIKNKVDCVLVGGLAAITHGAATMTWDLDVCFDFNPDNVRTLLHALEPVHPRVRAQSGWLSLTEYTPERLAQLDNLYITTDLGRLDLLGFIAGVGKYPEVKQHSVEIDLLGYPCRVLDLESLIKAKETLNRPKDQQVVLELRVIQEKLKSSKA